MTLTDTDRINMLEEILFSYASNEYARDKIEDMRENESTAKDYIIALADGLKYGNWPWIQYTKPNKLDHAIICEIFQNGNCSCEADK